MIELRHCREARRLGEALGTRDERILEDLQALGYTPEIIQILFVVPLIAVAWADGEVSKRERSLIQELAGVSQSENAAAHRQLTQWLIKSPRKTSWSGASGLLDPY